VLFWQFIAVDAFGFVHFEGFIFEKQDWFMHALSRLLFDGVDTIKNGEYSFYR